jgi:hypothetical protein
MIYQCDGMPTMMGCPNETTTTRPFTRTGKKKSGWLVAEGIGDDGLAVVPQALLYFCPVCTAIVEAQEARIKELRNA